MAEKEELKGVTKSGFEYEIDADALDDMELLEELAELDKGNVGPLADVIVSLLGEKQKKSLYEFCRDKKSGRVKATKVIRVLNEIMQQAQTTKN